MKRLLLLVVLVEVLAASSTALASPGAKIWAKRYNGTGNKGDGASSLAVSPDGTKVFVTGQSPGSSSGADYETIAYDASTGAKLWGARYNGPGNGVDLAFSLVVSPDGTKVFATGQSPGSSSGDDYATIAYDASSGNRLWVARYNGPGNGEDLASSLGISPDGTTVFVTGQSAGSSSGDDYATIAYDASSGNRLWVKRYNGPGNSVDDAYSLAVSPDGAVVFVTGTSFVSTYPEYSTVAYEAATGAKLWAAQYSGAANAPDVAHSLAVSPDGTAVFVTGSSFAPLGDFDYATIAYDTATGAKLWVKRYNGPGNSTDDAASLAVSPDGTNVFVSGASYGSTSQRDYATIAYNASSGNRLWVMRYNGPGNSDDYAKALRVSPDGNTVYVTGQSPGSSGDFDYATVAYDVPTGAKDWVARYNGPGNGIDEANSLGVSADGMRVFVTGTSLGSSTGYDYATVAYAAT